jgi:hypothetical protein
MGARGAHLLGAAIGRGTIPLATPDKRIPTIVIIPGFKYMGVPIEAVL